MTGKAASPQGFTFQRTFLPLELTEVFLSNGNSADLKYIGRASNGKDYAIKTIGDSTKGRIPASELFCYELAYLLDIATPDYHIITMRDSTLAFGSAWEGGVILLRDNTDILNMLTGANKPPNITEALSKIYALDIFVNNIDRHFGNYIFRAGYKSTMVLAMDFSRAWYEINPYGFDATSDNSCNTYTINNIIKKLGCYDKKIALSTLERIGQIPQDTIRQVISLMPNDWLDLNEASDFIDWWLSEDFVKKIQTLKQVI